MSSQVPQKIVLKSTTKISLNDRFTNIQKSKPTVTVQQVRTNMALQQQASAKNRRLAQQMANRPTVQTALKVKKENRYDQPWPNQHGPNNGYFRNDDMRLGSERSLQQRLGSNIKSRLTLNGPRGRGMGIRGGPIRGGPLRGRGRGRGSLQNQQSVTSGQSDQGSISSRGRGRGRGRGLMRGSFRGNNPSRGRGAASFPRGRGGQMTRFSDGDWRGRGGRGRGAFRGRDGFRGRDMSQGGRGRFLRGGRGRARGRGVSTGGRGGQNVRGSNTRGGPRGRGRGGQPKNMTKEQLDSQLDEYMSKTKTYLDAELDAYMATAVME